MMHEWSGCFGSIDETQTQLHDAGYLADEDTATSVFLAARLGKPLMIEGPAGVGKTELAKAVATITGADLIRLQCYDGLDEAHSLYEWNYKRQLLRIQVSPDNTDWESVSDDIFSEEFLLSRPLLEAIRRPEPTVLLIDEADKADVEMEGLMLEVLAEYQVTIPELGTIRAQQRPFVVLTSNGTRDLSEALKRRCLFLHLGYPSVDRERDILLSRVPELEPDLASKIARMAAALRLLDLSKPPSIAETIDWSQALIALGRNELDEEALDRTLGVILKNTRDQSRAREAFLNQAR
jgi:MoxR-like ATPase